MEGWGTKLCVGAELQATARLLGLGHRKWGAGSWGSGGGKSSRSRPEEKAAAIVLMSWRKWWEFVKGGPPPGSWNSTKGQRSTCF